MTRIIGKAPVNCTHTPKVEAMYDTIRITSGGYSGPRQQEFKLYGDLTPGCTARLIVELRTALRKVRDDRVRQLNGNVAEAEKPLA